MIERQIHLSSGGGAALQGYDGLLRFGYTKTRGIYALRVEADGEWQGMTLRAFWHLPDGNAAPSTLVVDGLVEAKTQKVLLQKALSLLPKKHEMVYSTCSVLQMENEDIVQSAVSMGICEVVPIEHPFLTDVPLLPTKVDGVVCVKPDERFEGFFVAKLRRK